MQGMINGPILLTGAAVSLYALFKVREQLNFGKIKTKDGDVLLATVIKNLSLNASEEEREDATKRVLDFIQGQKKAEVAENRDIVVDHGGLRALSDIIANPSQQNDTILENALLSIQLLVHGSAEQRNRFNSLGGIHNLFQLSISKDISSRLRLLSLACLRTATRFDINKRELDDDVPYGSEGSLTIAKESDGDLEILLGFLEETDPQLLRATLGVIAHTTQTLAGAYAFDNLNAVSSLIYHLNSMDAFIRKNAVVAIGNIVKHRIENNIDLVGNPDQLRKVFQLLSKDPRLNLKIKRAVIDILNAVGYFYINDKAAIEDYTIMFREQRMLDHTNVMFYLGFASTDRYLRQKIAKIEDILTNPTLAPEALAREFEINLKSMAEKIEVQKQQDMLRQQQQMMQMMGGGMGGMSGLSPQDLQMLQQMYGM